MLALIVAVESTISHHDLDFTPHVAWIWRVAGQSARKQAAWSEILFLGDSLVKMGIAPRVIESATGRRSYNLALASSPAPASYFLLRRALDAGARPEAVVVNFKPHLLAEPPRTQLRNWPELLSILEYFELSRRSRDAGFLAATLLARFLPSYRCRDEVRSDVLASLRGQSGTRRWAIVPYWRNWRVNLGAQIAPASLPRDERVDLRDRALFPAAWSCDPTNRLYVDQLIDLAVQHGSRIYWLIPPINPGVQAKREELGWDAAYSRFVRDVQARHPELVVIDGRHSGFSHSVFVDAVHMDRRGAAALSEAVAGVLASRPTKPWVRLPSFQPAPSERLLEDATQSTLVLDDRKARRR